MAESDLHSLQHGPAGPPGSAGAAEVLGGTIAPPLPPDGIALIPVRNFVLFPGTVMPVTIGRARSIAAAQQERRWRPCV